MLTQFLVPIISHTMWRFGGELSIFPLIDLSLRGAAGVVLLGRPKSKPKSWPGENTIWGILFGAFLMYYILFINLCMYYDIFFLFCFGFPGSRIPPLLYLPPETQTHLKVFFCVFCAFSHIFR